MSQSPPTTLGKYQIIREIARSNDIVYEAYDPVMNRRVALKELAMPGGASVQQVEDRIKRFLREARAAGSLVHGNIVTIYEVGEDAGRRYIAMEYLDGQNLRNLLDTKGFIEPVRAAEIAIEILKGLEFAHSHGVVHRDIKPDNIQLLENGDVKITDFGIARLTFEPNLTMDGQVFGTPSYMSPEQINGRDIDARSDVFSVGVILYEMLAGKKPFTGDSVVSITYAIMNQDAVQPGQCGPGLWNVIRQALDKSPQLRWGSAKEMMSALQDVVIQMKSGAVVAPTYSTPAQQPQVIPVAPPVIGQPQPYAYGQPYQPSGQIPVQTQYIPVPVYYPPKPRGPMVSPQTRVFLGRLFRAFLLVGTIVGLAVIAIYQGVNAFAPKNSASPGAPKSEPSVVQPKGSALREVVTVDGARESIRDAMNERVAKTRQVKWGDASRTWMTLISQDERYRSEAVDNFLGAAEACLSSGYEDRANEAYYQAVGVAGEDASLRIRINDWQAAHQL